MERNGYWAKGATRPPEYHVWAQMIARCENPNYKCWNNYGGRGIQVCERWRTSFSSFLEDMGQRPTSGHQLDRINNNGDYCPENCRWATRIENNANKRDNHVLTVGGTSMCIAEWARELGLRPGQIHNRLRRGWSVEDALNPSLHRNPALTRRAA